MSAWWWAFWIIEAAIAVYLLGQRFANKRPTSMDVAIGDEIGNLLLIILGMGLAAIVWAIYLWRHLRFAP